MWTYRQSNGDLLHETTFIGTGYSGIGIGYNNPDEENVPNVGPIPQGTYVIGDVISYLPKLECPGQPSSVVLSDA